MVKLVPVDPAEIPTERLGRRGRVSYPIIKQFLEMGKKVCMADLTGLDKKPTYLRSVLTSYIIAHKLPIKVFLAGGNMYLMRLDLDNEGQPISSDWEELTRESPTEGASGHLKDVEAKPITSEEVQNRFKKEKEKTTK